MTISVAANAQQPAGQTITLSDAKDIGVIIYYSPTQKITMDVLVEIMKSVILVETKN